jgi:hypothetical protein
VRLHQICQHVAPERTTNFAQTRNIAFKVFRNDCSVGVSLQEVSAMVCEAKKTDALTTQMIASLDSFHRLSAR